MAKTYKPIATQTLGSATNSVTFNSIPQTYTDLILITSIQTGAGATSADTRSNVQFNADTATNYSSTHVFGDGSVTGSSRDTGRAQLDIARNMPPLSAGGEYASFIYQIMNYSNTTTFKTLMYRVGSITNTTYKGTELNVGIWRSTSAITSIRLFAAAGATTYAAGSIFTLYGIKAS